MVTIILSFPGVQSKSTCFIHFIFLNQPVGVLCSRLLPLLVQQKVQQVSVAHLTLCLSIIPINDINLLTACQHLVELLDLFAFQGV